jgi:hypothetical protein
MLYNEARPGEELPGTDLRITIFGEDEDGKIFHPGALLK